MAVQDHSGAISGLLRINAVGAEIEGVPSQDFIAPKLNAATEYTFHDADRFFVDPATVPPERAATQRANMATIRAVAGDPYTHDPKLLSRLGRIKVPVLVIWGESGRIATPAHGSAYAEAFRGAHFEVVKEAGHLPQIEQPAATVALIDSYMNSRK